MHTHTGACTAACERLSVCVLQVFFRELPVSLLNGIPVEMVLATSTLEVRSPMRVVSV